MSFVAQAQSLHRTSACACRRACCHFCDASRRCRRAGVHLVLFRWTSCVSSGVTLSSSNARPSADGESSRSSDRAFVKRKEVVIPISVGVRAEIRLLTSLTNNTDVGSLASLRIEDVKRVNLRLDTGHYGLARPHPIRLGIPHVRDVLMRAVQGWFDDARYLDIGHC